jgi:DedD protein
MEKKKLLLISVSVGLFLVIVTGASILAFSPRERSPVDMLSAAEGRRAIAPGAAAVQPYPPVEEKGVSPTGVELVPPPPVPAMLENVIYINGENAEDAVKVERLNDGNTRTYITIPNSGPATESGVRFEAPKHPAAPVEIASAPKKEAPPAAQPPRKTPVAKPVAAPRAPATKPTAQSRADYWVQAGSFSNKNRADNAKTLLAEKSIGSLIVDGNVNGKIVYRVRIGPYTSQSEADYWLSLVKQIDGMRDSLIWKSVQKM